MQKLSLREWYDKAKELNPGILDYNHKLIRDFYEQELPPDIAAKYLTAEDLGIAVQPVPPASAGFKENVTEALASAVVTRYLHESKDSRPIPFTGQMNDIARRALDMDAEQVLKDIETFSVWWRRWLSEEFADLLEDADGQDWSFAGMLGYYSGAKLMEGSWLDAPVGLEKQFLEEAKRIGLDEGVVRRWVANGGDVPGHPGARLYLGMFQGTVATMKAVRLPQIISHWLKQGILTPGSGMKVGAVLGPPAVLALFESMTLGCAGYAMIVCSTMWANYLRSCGDGIQPENIDALNERFRDFMMDWANEIFYDIRYNGIPFGDIRYNGIPFGDFIVLRENFQKAIEHRVRVLREDGYDATAWIIPDVNMGYANGLDDPETAFDFIEDDDYEEPEDPEDYDDGDDNPYDIDAERLGEVDVIPLPAPAVTITPIDVPAPPRRTLGDMLIDQVAWPTEWPDTQKNT